MKAKQIQTLEEARCLLWRDGKQISIDTQPSMNIYCSSKNAVHKTAVAGTSWKHFQKDGV